MKKCLFLNFLLAFLTGCFTSRDYVLDYDYSYNGKFKRYKTFDFINTSSSSIKPNLLTNDKLVKKIIVAKLKTQGYFQTQKKPNFFIYYTLFYKSFEFASIDQPDINYWAKYPPKTINEEDKLDEDKLNEEIEKEDEASSDEKYYFTDKNLNNGTLMVIFWDRRRNKQIWRGYISGVFGENQPQINEIYLKSAVNKILNQYKFFAKGYIN